jgi:hypothetical protein
MPTAYSSSRTKTKLKCPKCHQRELARIARRGFLREHVLPLLGYFPWQCGFCGREELIRRRGKTVRRTPLPFEEAAREPIVSPRRMTR